MHVRIDETRRDNRAGRVDDVASVWRNTVCPRTDARDPAAPHDDDAIFDRLFAIGFNDCASDNSEVSGFRRRLLGAARTGKKK